METMHESLVFAKEMLNARPSKGSMKVFLVGSTFAVLGIASGVMEAVCSLFPEQDDCALQKLIEEPVTVTAQTKDLQTVIPEADKMDDEMEEMEELEAKAKEMPMLRQRRMSFRAHAS